VIAARGLCGGIAGHFCRYAGPQWHSTFLLFAVSAEPVNKPDKAKRSESYQNKLRRLPPSSGKGTSLPRPWRTPRGNRDRSSSSNGNSARYE
jgi:hypothetical protein